MPYDPTVYLAHDEIKDLKKAKATLTARVERLEAALRSIRDELHTSSECYKIAWYALVDATSHPPQQPEPQTGSPEG